MKPNSIAERRSNRTARKPDDVRAADLQGLLCAVPNTVTIGIMIVDRQRVICFVNRWLDEHWLPKDTTLVGRSLDDALEGRPAGRLRQAVHAALDARQASFLSQYLNRSLLPLGNPDDESDTGDPLSQNIMIRPIQCPVSGAHFCLIEVRDVSIETDRERKLRRKAAALARANDELERFAYAASHDLRAPLRALSMLPTWIEEDLVDAGVKIPATVAAHIHDMQMQTGRLDRLLADLLDYSLIGCSGMPEEVLDMLEIIDEAIAQLASPSGFTFRFEGDFGEVTTIRTELALVLRNLLGNAVKHHDHEDGTITIRGTKSSAGLELEIADDGPGIPAESREVVFDMFKTLRPRDEVEGSGLGLSIVRKVVASWGEEVHLSSPIADGRGTAFHFRIPDSHSSGELRAH